MANELWSPNPLCPWVTVQNAPSPNLPRWEVKTVVYQDAEHGDGTTNIYVIVHDAMGNPLGGIWVWQGWPDGAADKTTGRDGRVDFYMSGDSSFDPARNEVGPYSIYLRHLDYPTAVVRGMGLPLRRHVQYIITFQLDNGEGHTDPPEDATLEEVVLATANKVVWMPVNNDGALWKYAKLIGLQDQQTDELPFTYDGVDYLAQVFNLGIVYAKVGDWQNIRVIPK